MEDKIKTTTKRLDEKTEFIAVDFFRLLFAIGIVALHLAPMQDINETLNYFVVHVLTRLGVPFFFLVSGFFLQKKIQDVQKVKAYLARIFQLYVIYTVLYLPQIVYDYRKAGSFWVWNLLDFVRNFFLVGSYTQLWYFVGLIVATLLAILAQKQTETARSVHCGDGFGLICNRDDRKRLYSAAVGSYRCAGRCTGTT